MNPEFLLWLVFLAPVASFLVVVFILRPAGLHALASGVSIFGTAVSFAASLGIMGTVLRVPGYELPLPDYTWLVIGSFQLHIGFLADSLTAVMLVVVSSVSLLVQIYSTAYVASRPHDDPRYDSGDPPRRTSHFSRYFAYISLFTASMIGLVIADNLLQLFVFWEMVGLCSFLLVGYYFHRASAAAAAKKAFITTRLGDLGFLVALLILFNVAGTTTIQELFKEESLARLSAAGFLGMSALTWTSLGLFSGAVGKSAQFPLHVWLPDAMEGPTPVSALIHAATMVAAGVYLMGRMLPMVHHSAEAMGAIALIGAVTALMAAALGLVMTDIKRVMAYSTISQLGYMMLAVGTGAYTAAFFHLMNHAFFKALLFLGAGSVGHYQEAHGLDHQTMFDMRYMGGLKSRMPVTFWTLLIASLSLAGIPPLSGFWSKDEILAVAFLASPGLFVLGLITVFLTAFYVFRMLFLTFWHEWRIEAAPPAGAHALIHLHARPEPVGGRPAAVDRTVRQAHPERTDAHEQAGAESPAAMVVPLIILAVPAILSGLVNTPAAEVFSGFLITTTVAETLGEHAAAFNPGLAGLSTVTALLGVSLAWLMYAARSVSSSAFAGLLGGAIYRLLVNKYWLDFLYEKVIVQGLLYSGICNALAAFDRYVVDGAVNGAARATRETGRSLRTWQNGQLQSYGLVIFLGVVGITVAVWLRG